MRARQEQVLATGTYGSAGSVTVPLTALATSIQGQPANLAAIVIRLSKGVASTVRPYSASVIIRDSSEPLFDGSGAELLQQARERGESISAQLGSASAADACVLVWRPGYGRKVTDQQGAAGLFTSGSVAITGPTDAGQTVTYEIVAVLDGGAPRVHQRVLTKTLAGARQVPGDFLLARLRDSAFAGATLYTVDTNGGNLISGVSGNTLQAQFETSCGPAGDPVLLTAVAQTTLTGPNFVRSLLSDYSYGSGEKLPPLSRLPDSNGNVNATAGFTANLVVTQIYPRTRAESERLMRQACERAGVPYVGVKPDTDEPGLMPYSPMVNG